MQHFRVELHGVQALVRGFHRRHRAVSGMGDHLEAGRRLGDVVVVAHPADGAGADLLEQQGFGVHKHFGFAVFPFRGTLHPAAQQMHHQLAAVADAQHRHTQGKQVGGAGGGSGIVHAVGAAGQDDALGILGPDGLQRGTIGVDLAVYAALPDTAGDQLVILAAEVQHDHGFSLLQRWCLLLLYDSVLCTITNSYAIV